MEARRSWIGSAIPVLLCCASAAADDELYFDAPAAPIYAVGDLLAHGDLDGDGLPDLLGVSTTEDGEIEVVFGRGNGTYGPVITSELPGSVQALRLADVDGDGRDDLIVADVDVRTYLSKGDGTFGSPIVTPTGPVIDDLETGFVDGDGVVDVLAYDVSGGATVLLGNGDGTFVVVGTVAAVTISSILFADVTDDGIGDLVGSRPFPLSVVVRPGFGDGQFGASITTLVDEYHDEFRAGDVNEDGIADLVGRSPETPVLLLGLGGGVFAQPTVIDPTLGDEPPSLFDVDEDGHLDVLIDVPSENDVAILHGVGDGTFDDVVWLGMHGPVHGEYDVNDDGLDDLVLEEPVGTLLGLDGGGYAAPEVLVEDLFGPLVVDLDRDGFLDLVGVCVIGEFCIHPGLPQGEFGDPVTRPLSIRSVVSFSAGDFEADGDVDLVFLGSFGPGLGPGVDFQIRDGDDFASAGTHTVPAGPTHVAVADVDGDGRDDAIITSFSAGLLTIFYGQASGAPQAGPSPAPLVAPDLTVPADLDDDGDADIVVVASNTANATLTLLRSDPGGVFTTSQVIAGLKNGKTVLAIDLDEDGILDLTFSGFKETKWFRGVGDGTVLAGVEIPSCRGAADLDLDGHLDLIGFGETRFVSFGAGDGTFTEQVSFRGIGALAADIDVDGDLDLLGLPSSGESFGLLVSLNRASEAWSTIGEGLAGTGGLVPTLSGIGLPCVGETARLRLVDALPNGIAALFVGTEVLGAPFKGGTLVPAPAILVVPILLDAQGAFAHEEPWPPGAAGLTLVAQMWIVDPGGPQGLSSSAGLAVDVP